MRSFRYEREDAPKRKNVVRVSDYGGERGLCIQCTQLDYGSTREKKGILAEWIDLLTRNPTLFSELHFLSRVPQALFDAVCRQRELRCLDIKWGVYPDLSALENLKNLECLHLGSGRSVRGIEAIAKLGNLRALSVENFQNIHDYSPLQALRGLVSLDMSGDLFAPRNIVIRDLDFLKGMPQLQRFALYAAVVKSGDYSPLLSLRNAETIVISPPKRLREKVCRMLGSLPKLLHAGHEEEAAPSHPAAPA